MEILDVNKFIKEKDQKLVSSIMIFDPKNKIEPHPQGLFSKEIFGMTPKEESTKYGYIDFGMDVINPTAYKMLISLDQKLESLILMEKKYSLDNKGELVYDPNKGNYGITYFRKILESRDLNLRPYSKRRAQMIDFIYEISNDDLLFIDKYPVMPVQYRPLMIMANGQTTYSEINEYYLKLLRVKSGLLNDMTAQGLQKILSEFYEYLKLKVGKKSGIIRNKIMGKMQHYSGRQVIVGDPDLNLGEAKIPYRILIKVYEPFVLHQISQMFPELSLTKQREDIQKIHNKQKLISKEYIKQLEVVLQDKVILMKRDPSLHMGSWHQFIPLISFDDTIHLHPAYCPPLNADFDGDQMGVFALYSEDAIQEAKVKMFKRIDGYRNYSEEMFALEKDFVMGIYLLTKLPKDFNKMKQEKFDTSHVDDRYVYVKTIWNGQQTTYGRIIFYKKFLEKYKLKFINDAVDKKRVKELLTTIKNRDNNVETYSNALDDLKNIGRYYSTIINQSFPIDEFELPDKFKKEIEELNKIEDVNVYQRKSEQIKKKIHKYYEEQDTDTFQMVNSGSQKGWTQPDSLLIGKGIISDTKGKPFITKNSLSKGLSSDEYFVQSAAARYGIISRTRTTATTGYLARQLSYAMSSQVLSEVEDCGTTMLFEVDIDESNYKKFIGRYFSENNGITLKLFTENNQRNYFGKPVKFRSPIYCRAEDGICKVCFGKLSDKLRSKNIGIVGQSVFGEFLTQNIMKVFHTGGKTAIVYHDVYKDIANNINI